MEKLSPLKIVDAMPNYGVKEDSGKRIEAAHSGYR